DLYPGQFGFSSVKEIPTVRPNIHEGWGRVDIQNSLFSEHRSILYADEQEGVLQGGTKEYTVTVSNSSEPLRVTLVYSDYPGAASASRALVNDLDIVVIQGDRKFYPNGKNAPDHVNNVEGVDVMNPAKGTTTVQVAGYAIPKGNAAGRQPYALVISGGIE
ncbi:MAG: serine protease, partial [Deltaproteobacteria bacterium]|nr:serine protease [Deltaproteobacteria bacterium]